MALTPVMVDQLAQWCLLSDTIADVRAAARSYFFGYDEPGEVRYMEGVGDTTSRERRFLGWFALTFKLPDGRSPIELAAANILSGSEQISVINSIKESRYVLAVTAMVIPNKSLILKLEDEEFTIKDRYFSKFLNKGDAISAHIIPAGRRGWVIGPGWLHWSIRIMPGMQAVLKKLQISPIELERFLQQRLKSSEDHPKIEQPRDDTLKAAVARMTKEARAEGRQNFIMTQTQWKKLVLHNMQSEQINDFSKEIINRIGKVESVDEYNKWLGLATNIWNNTPQPDRGGKSAVELSKEYYEQKPDV